MKNCYFDLERQCNREKETETITQKFTDRNINTYLINYTIFNVDKLEFIDSIAHFNF